MHILGYGVETSANGGGSYMPYDTDGQPMTDEALENINRLNRNLKLYRALEEMNSSHISRGLRTVFSDRPDQNLRVFGIYEVTDQKCDPEGRSKLLPETPRQEPTPAPAVASGEIPLSQIYTSPNGTFSFNYPAGWQSREDTGGQAIFANFNLGEDLSLQQIGSEQVVVWLGGSVPLAELSSWLQSAWLQNAVTDPEPQTYTNLDSLANMLSASHIPVQRFTVGNRTAILVETPGSDYTEEAEILVQSTDNEFIIISAYTFPGEMENFKSTLISMAETMVFPRTESELAMPQIPFTITPYNYSLENIGDGWSQGVVLLAFENQTDDLLTIYAHNSVEFPNGFTVETAEGVTYPAHLGGTYEWNNRYETDSETINSLDLSLFWAVPSGFRVSQFMKSYGPVVVGMNYGIIWESATAATPTRIVSNDFPGLSFDLQNIPQDLQFPFDIPPTEIQTFSSLAGQTWTELGKIQITLTGRCGSAGYFRGYSGTSGDPIFLEAETQNPDLFHQAEVVFYLPTVAFYHDGYLDGFNSWAGGGITIPDNQGFWRENNSISLGPGQSEIGYIQITPEVQAGISSPPIVVLWDVVSEQYKIFDARECTITTE